MPARRTRPTGAGVDAADTASTRRLRKRELDRNAQRNARERTKNRIAYLERLVEDLRQDNAGTSVDRLLEQLSEVTKQRDNLSRALEAIDGVLTSTKHADASITGPRQTSNLEHPVSTTQNSPAQSGLTVGPEDLFKAEDERDPIIPTSGDCDCSVAKAGNSPIQGLNRWRFANEVLQRQPSLSADTLNVEDATAEDTPVRAMLEGWEAVEAAGRLPPLWQKLRKIDEVIFSSCSKVERLAAMRIMHLLYRYHAGPSEERKADLPAWYLSRPSQSIAHSFAIDFFPWPGLRERFVFLQHRYCSNVFWELLASSARILWPFEFRDCYTYNVSTGRYAVSSGFDKTIRDINCWTMRSEIYERFPEFYSDIPAYREVPASLPDPQQRQAIEEAAAKAKSSGLLCSRSLDPWAEAQTMLLWSMKDALPTQPALDPILDFFPITTS